MDVSKVDRIELLAKQVRKIASRFRLGDPDADIIFDVADEIERLRTVLATFTHHHVSEDCWYSCPLADCCRDSDDKCNCGADRAIKALAGT